MQEWAELRLPIDSAELQAASNAVRGGTGLGKAELLLEMRAQLSTAMPWAPMVSTCLPNSSRYVEKLDIAFGVMHHVHLT